MTDMYYKFSLDAPGSIQLNVTHNTTGINSASIYWNLELIHENGTVVYNHQIAGQTADFNTVTIGLPAGTHYVKMRRASTYANTSVPYNLTVKYTKSSTWESEFNDTFATADPVAVNTAYSGTLYKNAMGLFTALAARDEQAAVQSIEQTLHAALQDSKRVFP